MGDGGMPPAPGWRKCTAYRRPGAGGMPLALRLSEGLGVIAGTALKSGRRRHVALRVDRNTFGNGDPVKF